MAPLVSILIPSYNAERYIVDAVESALAQTYPSIEAVCVDDGGRWFGSHAAIGFHDVLVAENQVRLVRNQRRKLSRRGSWAT